MTVLGLTGGVGMGKSTAATLLAEHGVTIVDTDVLARQLVEPGQPALAEIQRTFGSDILAADGSLRRDLLARRVFSDSTARKKLEAILHPRIRELWQMQLAEWRSNLAEALPSSEVAQKGSAFCVVIPLLFETQAESEFDATICIACSCATQRHRLSSRGWSADEIAQRLQSQLSAEEKMARANYVAWNESSRDVLLAQLERILRCAAKAA